MRIAILILLVSQICFGQTYQQSGCDSVLVYFVDSPQLGANIEELVVRPAGFPFGNPSATFTEANRLGGLPDIAIPYTNSLIHPDLTYSSPADVLKVWAWIDTRGLGTIDLQDVNQNTGERIWPFFGKCCTNPVPLEELQVNTLNPRGYEYLTTLEEGIHFIGWLATDISANGGLQIQYAPTGTTTFAEFPDARTFAEKPKVDCKRVSKCNYELAEDESYTKIEICEQIFPAIIAGESADPTIDTDEQELTFDPETKRITIERGNVIDLTVMPTWTEITAPTLTAFGSASINLQQVLESDQYWYTQRDGDCREHYKFEIRIRGEHLAAGTWGRITVPNIGGWDRDIKEVTMYRYSGNVNEDDGFRGAMGDAPIMAAELKEWSNSGLIYLNQVNDRSNDYLFFIDIEIHYRRN